MCVCDFEWLCVLPIASYALTCMDAGCVWFGVKLTLRILLPLQNPDRELSLCPYTYATCHSTGLELLLHNYYVTQFIVTWIIVTQSFLDKMAMFCTLPRTSSHAHRSLRRASIQRHLLSLSIQIVAKRSVTDLTGQTQAVLPPSTVKQFLKANKLSYSEGHAALTLSCPLCERETSQTVFINKTTGGLVCPPCKVHGELIRLA